MNSKKKGNRVEREISKILSEGFKENFKRVPMSGAYCGGKNYDDKLRKDAIEILSGDIISPDNFKFSIEVKSRKTFNFFDFFNSKSELFSWFEQCENDSNNANKNPMLIIKINNHQAVILFKTTEYDSEFKFKNWNIMMLSEIFQLNKSIFFKEK
jgi:hypothetical protein